MARPLRIEFKEALDHILSRGNERRDIFFVDDDYKQSEMRQKYCLIKSMINVAGRP